MAKRKKQYAGFGSSEDHHQNVAHQTLRNADANTDSLMRVVDDWPIDCGDFYENLTGIQVARANARAHRDSIYRAARRDEVDAHLQERKHDVDELEATFMSICLKR